MNRRAQAPDQSYYLVIHEEIGGLQAKRPFEASDSSVIPFVAFHRLNVINRFAEIIHYTTGSNSH